MKKIINGKKYDTETANQIGYHSNTDNKGDFRWWGEALYQKKTGEFFIHGEGNAASKYARSISANAWCGDERIIPLTLDDAKEWAAKFMEVDEYEKIFGEVEE